MDNFFLRIASVSAQLISRRAVRSYGSILPLSANVIRFTYSIVLGISLPFSVLRLQHRTRFPLSRSAAMHRTPCTRSQPLCKYSPSIASRRRTDTLTPFVYTNSITSKAKIMLRRQRGYRSHKHPFKCERLFIFLSYHPHREKSREKSNFYETKNIFSARKNLIYAGARLSYILWYNVYFSVSSKSA